MVKMNKEEIETILIELLVNDFGDEKADVAVTADTNIVTEFMLNSVDALELLLKIEERFDIEIPDEDLNIELIQNVRKLSAYIYDL